MLDQAGGERPYQALQFTGKKAAHGHVDDDNPKPKARIALALTPETKPLFGVLESREREAEGDMIRWSPAWTGLIDRRCWMDGTLHAGRPGTSRTDLLARAMEDLPIAGGPHKTESVP